MALGGFLVVVALQLGYGYGYGNRYLGPEGEPLPFSSDEEVEDFLRAADVVEEEVLEEGRNGTLKVLLERDGVRAHAAFRTVSFSRSNLQIGRWTFKEFRDSHRYECAAYGLSRMLGLGRVPPAVPRTLAGREGSLQLWIEGARDETSEGFRPPEAGRWARQLWSMYLFDNLLFNIDRNSGNILVDSRYDLWLIDHTRAFQLVPELLDDRVIRVERSVWERLGALNEYDLQRRLGEYLDTRELHALARRRELLVERIEKLIAERGEALVLY